MEPDKNITREMYVLQAKLKVMEKKSKMLSSQMITVEKALNELDKTSETEVYKIIGDILIKKEVTDVIDELQEKKDKITHEMNEVRNQLEDDLKKYKELGEKYSINTSAQESNYQFERQNNIFNMTDFNKKADS
jgi:prefoldin beta subunit